MPEENTNERLFFDEEHKIIGCAFNVYNQLGYGFLEQVYQSALECELKHAGIPFESQKEIPVYYHGEKLTAYYKADLLCFDNIILELKATRILSAEHEGQLINYLKATGVQVGILINFGNKRKLEYKRLVFTNTRYIKNENKKCMSTN